MTSTQLGKRSAFSMKPHFADRLGSIRVADIVLALYVIVGIVFVDGSLVVQASRLLLVGIAAIELVVKPFKASLIQLWQILFIGFAGLSILWAYDKANAQQMFLTLVINGVCLIALVYLVHNDPLRVKIFVISAMVAPTILMVRLASEGGLLVFLDARSSGATSANIVGMTAAFGFGFAYLCFSRGLIISRGVAVILMSSNLGVTLLSASRKALIVVALIVFLYSWFNRAEARVHRWVKTCLALLVGVFGYWFVMNVSALYALVGNRIDTMINGFLGTGVVDSSTTTRMSLIENGMQWFRERPVAGYGADNFVALMEIYDRRVVAEYAHNNFVEVLVNFGLVGIVLFYWFYLAVLFRGRRHAVELGATGAMFSSILVSLLLVEYGMVDYYSRIFMMYVSMAWAVVGTNLIHWDASLLHKSTKSASYR